MLEAEITEVAHDVWEAMFGVQLHAGTGAQPGHPSLTGIVHIAGAWQGAVTLQCSVTLATRLTEQLFGECTDDELHDLVGELTNQLGGNIKAMLPEPSTLSLPAVALGADYELRVSDTRVTAQVALACDDEPVVVTVLAKTT